MDPTKKTPAIPEWSPADLETTTVGRNAAWLLIGGFLAIVVTVPLVDIFKSETEGRGGGATLRVLTAPPTWSDYPFPLQSGLHSLPDPARHFEQDLEAASWLRGQVRPWMQHAHAGVLLSSTTDVVIGARPWLFFRPGIEHLSGNGFLPHPEDGPDRNGPLSAIIDFHRQCQAAGATLLVVPINDKAAIEAAHLTGQGDPAVPLENPDAESWRAQLDTAGVAVMPITDLLRQRAYDGDAYLHQDTHWTPGTMLAVARRIAFHPLVSDYRGSRKWKRDARQVTGTGDLARVLGLPADSSVVVPQSIQITQVSDAQTGSSWASDPAAQVLLLGDSFSNIYQAPDLGWGENGGLGAQLAFLLRSAVEVIAVNGDGLHAPRAQLASRPSPLSGKRLVLWVFAERSLSPAGQR